MIAELFAERNIKVEWKTKLERFGPASAHDYRLLRSINVPAYFTLEQYDHILWSAGQYGFGIESVGYEPK